MTYGPYKGIALLALMDGKGNGGASNHRHRSGSFAGSERVEVNENPNNSMKHNSCSSTIMKSIFRDSCLYHTMDDGWILPGLLL